MYSMQSKDGELIEAANIAQLVEKSGYSLHDITAIYGVHRPSPSMAIRVLVQYGIFIPVSGPDWFLALKADEELIARAEQDRREMDYEYENERQAEEWLREQIIVEMGAYDAALAQIIKDEEWGRVQFSSSEREAWAKKTATEYWRIASSKLPQTPNSTPNSPSVSVSADKTLEKEIIEKDGGSAYMEDGSYRLSVRGDAATFQYYSGSGKSQALGSFIYNMRTGEINDLGKTGVGLTEKTVRGVLSLIRPLRKGEPFIPDRRR